MARDRTSSLSWVHIAYGAYAAASFAMFTAPSDAAGRSAAPDASCFTEIARGRGTDLVCSYPAWLADKERDELRRLTRDVLQDARCVVSVRITRALITSALIEANHTFEAPPQPVACEITTNGKPFQINATFAPRVVIKDGVAIDASPGLANVSGVNSYVAWPVVEYINRSATVRTEMIKMINTYLSMRVARHG
jgi:hypothetical protein